MKKLLIKTSILVIPIFLIYILKENFYSKEKGDLFRMGYIFDTKEYNSIDIFRSYYKKKIYKDVSEINLNQVNSFDIISIGDSYSEQVEVGYQNYTMLGSNKKVLNIDRKLYDSPIQVLNNLLNGDFFKTNKTKYVILQNAEREFVKRSLEVPKNMSFTIDSIKKKQVKNNIKKEEKKAEKKPNDFFSKEMVRFVMYNFNYMLDDNAFVSQTYKVNTTKNLFSVSENNLLFYNDDIIALKLNNDKKRIQNLNDELNFLADRLSKLDIKLIVLPAPDKYDLYYDYIVNKEKYEKPILLDYLFTLKKKYIYLNSKKVFSEAIKKEKDVYFYDDTHWSPKASKLIASEILRICK